MKPFETSRFLYNDLNLDGAQEPEHIQDFSPKVLDNTSAIEYDKVDPELILIKLKEILAIIQKKKQERQND